MTNRWQPILSRILALVVPVVLMALPAVTAAALAQGGEVQRPDGKASTQIPTQPPRPTNLEQLDGDQSTGLLGKKVVGPSGGDLGMIVDVIVDRSGRPQAAVIDFGGFLGVGSRKIAVDWELLQFDPHTHDGQVTLNVDRNEVQGAPEYKADAASTEMVGPPLVGPSKERGAEK